MAGEREYTEEERLAYWQAQFPSGRFWCRHCFAEHDLMEHRLRQRSLAKPPNECRCGAYLAIDADDAEESRPYRHEMGDTSTRV